MKQSTYSQKYLFYDTEDGNLFNVKSVKLSNTGSFDDIVVTKGDEEITLSPNDYDCVSTVLDIKGVGVVIPGDILTIHENRKEPKPYILDFGWHINTSNQHLFSWFLRPIEHNDRELWAEFPKARTLTFELLSNVVYVERRNPTVALAEITYVSEDEMRHE